MSSRITFCTEACRK